MKQRKTTVLIAIISLVSYAMGHASLTVKEGWNEPIVVWLVIVLKTGQTSRIIDVIITHAVQPKS